MFVIKDAHTVEIVSFGFLNLGSWILVVLCLWGIGVGDSLRFGGDCF